MLQEFIRNPTLLFRRVALVLRKGGLFGLTCPKRSEDCNEPIDNRIDVYMRTESELAHAADMAGLEVYTCIFRL